MGQAIDWKRVGGVVRQIRDLKMTYSEGAKHFGIEVWKLYEYNRRANRGLFEQNAAVVEAAPSGTSVDAKETTSKVDTPRDGGMVKKAVSQLPEEVQELICEYRREHPDHGFKKIAQHLRGRHQLVVSRKLIRKVLKSHELLELDSSFDRDELAAKGTRRFEAPYPRALYQMDVKHVYLQGQGVCYLVNVLDDFSRFCVASELCGDERGPTMVSVLHRAIGRYGAVEKVLTDQGPCFYTWSYQQSLFGEYLDEMKIEHVVAEPHSPQTLGKVERFHQTLDEELLRKVRFANVSAAREGIGAFVQVYNFERPHQGIGGARPADRFFGAAGESARIESSLAGQDLDFSSGYVVMKLGGQSLCVVVKDHTLQVLLNGKLLKEE